MDMAKRRELTPEEKTWAENLRRIWERKKNALGLTQEKAAAAMGFKSQGSWWQYLHGKIPLNTDAKLKAAKLLQVSVKEIDPSFEIPVKSDDVWMEVSSTFSAKERMDALNFILFQRQQASKEAAPPTQIKKPNGDLH